ncbi:MAG: penicillin acylase family protein, partial [Comamonadaceae bacterium]|nr:penicillin acylase family protein [Comamonadaceae bacterium]
FVSAIANAQPPAAKAGPDTAPPRIDGPLHPPPRQVGGAAGVGSNMYGFGRTATGGASVLFGNPHWYWKGADRFYQAQLTIAGQIDVSGVSFLGVPLVLIGFNEHVAWSHTVSTAQRFGLFQLQLDPSDPTRYLVDGRAVPLQAATIQVQDLLPNGNVQTLTRTLYKSSHGPIAHLGAMHPALGWTAASAIAIRDINASNHRSFRNWLRWGQARSLDEFIRIQKEEAAVPWVNTVAVGRDSGQAWYADMGAVPNAPPELLAACATPVSEALAKALPGVPVLNGSRSACQWQSDPDSAQPGAIGPARMPSLRHDDYVANMNDSHWLANPERPLTGFDPIFGPTGVAQSLRTRLGHQMVQDRFDGADGLPDWRASADAVRQIVLGSRVYSAELFKADLLSLACSGPAASLRPACDTLRLWDNRGHARSRGSHLWDEFWRRLPAPDSDDGKKLFAVPFNARDPLHTPRGFAAQAAPTLRATLEAAAEAVTRSGAALDAERGSLLYATRDGEAIALYGGCGEHGYFTIACSEKPLGQGGYSMDGQPHGNTYLQVVSFTRTGVQAHTLLAHSQSDDPASPHHGDYTRAYARKEWLRVPFTESEITASPGYRRFSLRE